MAKEDFDLDKFLGEVEVEAGEEETLRKFFSRDKNKGFVLRQSDYDKKMNTAKAEAATAAQALADKQEVYDRLVTENIAYKGNADKAVSELKEKMESELATLRGKAVLAAELAGLSLDDIEDGTPIPTKVKAKEFNIAELDGKFVKPEDLNRLATGHINLTLDLGDVQDVHEELIGKKMNRKDKETLLAEYSKDIAAANKVGAATPQLMQTADRLYEFSAKRGETETARIKKIETDAEARGREKAIAEMSERGLPAPRRAGTGSPIFNHTRKEGEKPVAGRGVALAMKALNEKQAAA